MEALRYWIAASYLPGVGTSTLLKILTILGDIKSLFNLTLADYQAIGFAPYQIKALLKPNWQQVDSDIAWSLASPSHHILYYDSLSYPPQLKSINDPPTILYVKGDASLLQAAQLAMVGSRHPSASGLIIAREFAASLASADMVVTSGLAAGIDTASHEGALSANGKTIAVFGTGLLQVYPAKNKQLAEKIVAEGGALVSEFSLSSSPRPMHFPKRNRIISGLSLGVVVVEAAIKSGSLVTARHALTQGRDVFAVPGSIQTVFSRGCHFLIKQGAALVESADDILNNLGWGSHSQESDKAHNGSSKDKCNVIVNEKHTKCENISVLPLDLSAKEHHILSLITSDWVPFDQILLLSRLTMGELSSMLLSLELRGLIQSVAGGYRCLVSV